MTRRSIVRPGGYARATAARPTGDRCATIVPPKRSRLRPVVATGRPLCDRAAARCDQWPTALRPDCDRTATKRGGRGTRAAVPRHRMGCGLPRPVQQRESWRHHPAGAARGGRHRGETTWAPAAPVGDPPRHRQASALASPCWRGASGGNPWRARSAEPSPGRVPACNQPATNRRPIFLAAASNLPQGGHVSTGGTMSGEGSESCWMRGCSSGSRTRWRRRVR